MLMLGRGMIRFFPPCSRDTVVGKLKFFIIMKSSQGQVVCLVTQWTLS